MAVQHYSPPHTEVSADLTAIQAPPTQYFPPGAGPPLTYSNNILKSLPKREMETEMLQVTF